jgi:hypothetical protein
MAEEEKSESGFIIIDRRGSKGEEAPGEARAQAGETREEAPEPEREPAQEPGAPGGLPGVDFATFALSLGTSALYHMGLVGDPESGERAAELVGDPESGERAAEPNLPLASQTIDTLAMLETKTRGNLDPEEARLLEGLLYELRMRFVEAGK